MIIFSSSTIPTYLINELRSIERLCAYLNHKFIDTEKYQLDDLKEFVDEIEWNSPINIWIEVFNSNINPLNCKQDEIKFRATGSRKGKHNFTSMDLGREAGGFIHDRMTTWKANMKDFDIEILVDLKDEQLMAGIALSKEKLSLRNRCELGSTTLNACIAYGLIKIANVKDGDVVLDPMAGVGSIPIECSQVFPNSICLCSDIKSKDIDKAKVNADKFSKGRVILMNADATNLPIRDSSVDIVVSDLPFGKRHGSFKKNRKLYPKMLKEMTRILKSGGRAAFLTSEKNVMRRTIENYKSKGWILDKEWPCDVGGLGASIFELTLHKTNN